MWTQVDMCLFPSALPRTCKTSMVLRFPVYMRLSMNGMLCTFEDLSPWQVVLLWILRFQGVPIHRLCAGFVLLPCLCLLLAEQFSIHFFNNLRDVGYAEYVCSCSQDE